LTRLHRPSDSEDSSLPPALRRPRTARSAFSRCSRRQAVRLDARCCAAGGFAAAVLQSRQRSTPPNSKPSTSPRAQGACLVAPAAQPRRSNTRCGPQGDSRAAWGGAPGAWPAAWSAPPGPRPLRRRPRRPRPRPPQSAAGTAARAQRPHVGPGARLSRRELQTGARARPHVLVVADLMRLVAHPAVALQHGVHVGAGVLEQLVVGVEDHERDVAAAQHAQLHRLFHQAILALCEGDLDAHRSVPLQAQRC